MKKFICLLIALCWIAKLAGQHFIIENTNTLHVDLQNQVSTSFPTIFWIKPEIHFDYSDEMNIEVLVNVQSSAPLEIIKVIITQEDDSTIADYPIEQGIKAKTIRQNAYLIEGENYIKVIAKNIDGGMVSSMKKILYGSNAMTKIDKNRKDYALIFATDHYDNWDNLGNPILDGDSIGYILKELYGFEVELIKDPTRSEVLNKIYEYHIKNYGLQDQLLIYFAGHGYYDLDTNRGYLVFKNSVTDDPGKSSYISHSEFSERVNKMNNRHILLVINACFAGKFDPEVSQSTSLKRSNVEEEKYFARASVKPTRKFLTNGAKSVLDGFPGEHSPFAKAFIKSLNNTGIGDDGMLTYIELCHSFVQMENKARTGPFGNDHKESDFIFIRETIENHE